MYDKRTWRRAHGLMNRVRRYIIAQAGRVSYSQVVNHQSKGGGVRRVILPGGIEDVLG